MKKIIFILLSLPIYLFGQTYYVTPRGNDSNDGSDTTSAHAFLTIAKGISMLDEGGDTLFIRGGIYYLTNYLEVVGSSGSSGNPICVYAYPPDHAAGNIPIIDAINGYRITGMWVHDVSWWKFWGLTIRNALQDGDSQQRRGFLTTRAANIFFIQCVAHNNGGWGFDAEQANTKVYYINCDSYNNIDTLYAVGNKPGNNAGGFGLIGNYAVADTATWGEVYAYGCRVWGVSDNAYGTAYGIKSAIFDRCWAIDVGRLEGDGRGFALGLLYENSPPINQYIVKNCLALYCRGAGFNVNSNQRPYQIDIKFYNNTEGWSETGFRGYEAVDETVGDVIFRNNISIGHSYKVAYDLDAQFLMLYSPWSNFTTDHNSWDASADITLSADDFIDGYDWTEEQILELLTGPRQADGSLPDLGDFLQIAEGSDLIAAGIGVGLLYDGEGNYHNDPPDLGAYAYSAVTPEPPEYPEVTTVAVSAYNSFRATTGGSGIVTAQGTIAAKGVCWSTSINPTIANSKTSDGTGTDTYASEITGLSSGTTYHIRAYVTDGAAQTSYGADVSLTTPSVNYFLDGVKLLYDPATGKLLKR